VPSTLVIDHSFRGETRNGGEKKKENKGLMRGRCAFPTLTRRASGTASFSFSTSSTCLRPVLEKKKKREKKGDTSKGWWAVARRRAPFSVTVAILSPMWIASGSRSNSGGGRKKRKRRVRKLHADGRKSSGVVEKFSNTTSDVLDLSRLGKGETKKKKKKEAA